MGADDELLQRFEAVYRDRSGVAEIFDDLERVHADYLQTCDELLALLDSGSSDDDVQAYIRRREPALQMTRKKLFALAAAYLHDFSAGNIRDEPLHRFVQACYAYFDVIAGGQPTVGSDSRQTSYEALRHILQQLADCELAREDAAAAVHRCKQQLTRRSDEVIAAYAALKRSGGRPAAQPEGVDEVDFVIITMREDEFRAVLKRFKPEGDPLEKIRSYNVSTCRTRDGTYRVLTTRTLSQGNIEATNIVHDVLKDVRPRCICFVGIAGGRPDDDFTLGDVVVATQVQDYTLHSVDAGADTTYHVAGGPISKRLLTFIVNLPARERELADWSSEASIIRERPSIDLEKLTVTGPPAWKTKVKESLKKHFEKVAKRRPKVVSGPLIASDGVIKDPKVLSKLLGSSRSSLAVEMESAGAYRVASENGIPFVAIRGISDIVGLKRESEWTAYACDVAAAFTYAFLRLRPIAPRE